ncbi:ScbA/BarX family gamma-butyrolactone biosynthesis protein [Streptomyces sp. NPDC046261]|uniref:ScbA/BarX family gamma-butyrolactone biosynthesis protein n=1 Tax=Streptomyces sp. NPDC046261 TaxID=3157200 RepID=UPI0033ED178B
MESSVHQPTTANGSNAPRPPAVAPTLTSTVPREFVHRAAIAEVFLTGCAGVDETHFSLTAQWPRAHAFFTADGGTRHDPLLAAETIRQTGLFLAHTELNVPMGHHFLLQEMEFTTHEDRLEIGNAPTDLTIAAACVILDHRERRFAFRMDITIRRGDETVASGGGRFTCIPPGLYRRMRGRRGSTADPLPVVLPTRAEPYDVGRETPRDVVLSPTARRDRWVLNPDLRHATLFDHPCDHIPGMVLVEAARQAAYGTLRPRRARPSRVAVTFHRYAELDSPCTIDVTAARAEPGRPADGLTTEVTGTQDGEPVFTCTLADAAVRLRPTVAA